MLGTGYTLMQLHKKIIITSRGKAVKNKPIAFFVQNLINRLRMSKAVGNGL